MGMQRTHFASSADTVSRLPVAACKNWSSRGCVQGVLYKHAQCCMPCSGATCSLRAPFAFARQVFGDVRASHPVQLQGGNCLPQRVVEPSIIWGDALWESLLVNTRLVSILSRACGCSAHCAVRHDMHIYQRLRLSSARPCKLLMMICLTPRTMPHMSGSPLCCATSNVGSSTMSAEW